MKLKMKRKLILTGYIFLILSSFSQVIPDQSMLMARAPARFKAMFHTTKGDFTVEVYREWSPAGADRLYQALKTGFYNSNGIFRVQTGYVIQFGIGDNRALNEFWDKRGLPDEPSFVLNSKGTLSYARDGINSRTVQLFINLKDNVKLDTVNYNGVRGFTPVAKIIRGFETVEKFYAGYGFEPANHQDSIMVSGNAFLKKKFPQIDYIIEATITEE
jgi:peptidyl-prolyl cis-trans isomerase A (cyclophilin A)